MKGEQIDIIDNIVQAISILNKTEEYLESLPAKLSEYDTILVDYEHIIELTPIEQLDAKKLIENMQKVYFARRKVKDDMKLGNTYKNNIEKLKELNNREFLIATIKKNRENISAGYTNRILTAEQVDEVMKKEKKKVGRPKKVVNMKGE